ncbi:MAG: aromatic hydrocarbon degradation protein [Alcanivorax sp.]|nr:aromatic hydrocarbon degradation protein [Alcanivorax sp.]
MASMGNIGTTYGVTPLDIGTAQAMSMFNSGVAATYYNPAYLARDRRGQLSLGILSANTDIDVRTDFASSFAPERDGTGLGAGRTEHVLIGMKTDMSDLFSTDRALVLGLMAGIEEYGTEMLGFSANTSDSGQYFRYGSQPLFLNIGVGANIAPGIDVGASLRVTLEADADLVLESTPGGVTSNEQIAVSAKPVLSPILGLTVNWGEVSGAQEGSWQSRIETALTYRKKTASRADIDALAVIPGLIDAGLGLALSTLHAFQPEIYAAGISYADGDLRLSAVAELQRWSQLEREFATDTVRDQADMRFEDVLIPRLGMSYRASPVLTVVSGLSYERSPLDRDESLGVNYFDNDRVVLGLGGSIEFAEVPGFNYPMRLDVAYQYQHLIERKFDLTSENINLNPYETVKVDGNAHDSQS